MPCWKIIHCYAIFWMKSTNFLRESVKFGSWGTLTALFWSYRIHRWVNFLTRCIHFSITQTGLITQFLSCRKTRQKLWFYGIWIPWKVKKDEKNIEWKLLGPEVFSCVNGGCQSAVWPHHLKVIVWVIPLYKHIF